MEAKELIEKINTSVSPVQVFSDLINFQDTFKKYSKLIHPDLCKEPGSNDAFIKLKVYKDDLEKGKKFKDDAGVVSYWVKNCEFIGDEKLLKKSIENYKTLTSLQDDHSLHFQKYLPKTGKFNSANEIEFTFKNRCVPLSSIGTLNQEYVNFILSRMLEFTGWINQIGYSHAGINPDSIWVVPETHGIQCMSFYHFKRLGTKLTTISGKYSQLYPSEVFSAKLATSNIDIELAKRTAVYLLGDKSGTGNSLRKTHNTDFLDFIQKTHNDPIECFKDYRKMLSKNFDTKEFHILNI